MVCAALLFTVTGASTFLPSARAQTRSPGNITYIHSRIYNAYGHLITTTDANNNQTDYAYDAVGNLIQMTDALGIKIQMTYDWTCPCLVESRGV